MAHGVEQSLSERVFAWKWRIYTRTQGIRCFFFPHRVYRTRKDPPFLDGPHWTAPKFWRVLRGRP